VELRASGEHNLWQDWLRLTRLRLEQQPFREAVEIVQLRCADLEAAMPGTGNLFADPGQREPRERIVDVLSTRLGSQSVSHLRCRDAHLPEQSCALASASEKPDRPAVPPVAAQRPFWLVSDPEPLREENGTVIYWGSPLTLVYGPERIEDNWWDKPVSRDYFVAQNLQGQRFWIFFERRQRRWFLHGIFS
jgi:protein ImuB